MPAGSGEPPSGLPFSERDFYLREFRGRTIAFSGEPGLDLRAAVEGASRILRDGGSRVLLLSDAPDGLELESGVEAAVWRRLAKLSEAEVRLDATPSDWPRACAEAVLRFGVTKWVWLDREGGVQRGEKRESFVNHAELKDWLGGANARRELFRAIDFGLDAGIGAINLCRPEGLEDELFTYAGSGTLFTRERYVSVRRLGVDDFDAAADLLARGDAEGYLAPRSEAERDRLLAHGFGAFVEGAHLAGIGALLEQGSGQPAEIAGLYTLTRFLGEGIGAHLVAFAKTEARRRSLPGVFACTTSDRVGAFFERNGFRRVEWRHLPDGKWRAYDPERRAALLCFLDDKLES